MAGTACVAAGWGTAMWPPPVASFPAFQLLRGVGLASGDSVRNWELQRSVTLYCHDMQGPTRRLLYVGRRRAAEYGEALQAETNGGGPQHRRWRDVPQALQVAWQQGLRPAGYTEARE